MEKGPYENESSLATQEFSRFFLLNLNLNHRVLFGPYTEPDKPNPSPQLQF
jgi:hypothetical protein